MALPRFSGIPTFMRVPYCTNIDELDIVLAGIPFDGGVTARPGARFGPREIRNMSSMTRAIHHVSRFNPFDVCRVGDIGDVPFTDLFHLERSHEDIRRFFEPVFAAGKIALSAGGDHSITYPIFQAMAPKAPIGMVHIDAHTDTWDSFKGSKFTHGARFAARSKRACWIRNVRSRSAFAARRIPMKAGGIRWKAGCGWCLLKSSTNVG
ncbi:Agmatinase [Caballeronia sordidicola]|uniref:Agmatinase n=1 Tax=Caballeronia sordidicola TaxID=196367 RepID=A0A242ME20_CABSO|nr:Agmatinase [Caballeronia sordidicola]